MDTYLFKASADVGLLIFTFGRQADRLMKQSKKAIKKTSNRLLLGTQNR